MARVNRKAKKIQKNDHTKKVGACSLHDHFGNILVLF